MNPKSYSVSKGNLPKRLFLAAKRGDYKTVDLLLACCWFVNWTTKDGTTPLSIAVRYRHKKVVELILNVRGVDVNKANKHEVTPLVLAAGRGHLEVVELLLNMRNINVNKADENGDTALIIAAYHGHEKVVELLLTHRDIQVNLQATDDLTPLEAAAMKGHQKVVEILLKKEGLQVSKSYIEFTSPVHLPLTKRDLRMLTLLDRKLAKPKNEHTNCIVCMDQPVEVVLVPCGHQIACGQCAHQWNEEKKGCPMDRIDIFKILPLNKETPDEKTTSEESESEGSESGTDIDESETDCDPEDDDNYDPESLDRLFREPVTINFVLGNRRVTVRSPDERYAFLWERQT